MIDRRRKRLEWAALASTLLLLIMIPFAAWSVALQIIEGEGFLPPGTLLFAVIASMHFSRALADDKSIEREASLRAEIARRDRQEQESRQHH